MIRRTLGAAIFAVLVCSMSSACSSDSDSGGKQTGLAKAMASVSGAGAATKLFQYSDLARMRALKLIDPAGIADNSKRPLDLRWATVSGLGLGQLANAVTALPDQLGLNALAANSSVAIGQPPDTAIRIEGKIDTDAVKARLTKLGAKTRTFGKATGLSLRGDNVADATSPLVRYGIITAVNQVVVDDDAFSASPNSSTLQLVRGGGKSLLDTGKFGEVAACLGEVIGAVIYGDTTDGATTLVAAGVRDPTSATAADTEVLCFLPASGREKAVQQAVSENMTLSSTTGSGVKLNTVLDKITVDRSGSLVRATVTVRADSTPGFVLNAIALRDYRVWDGSCPPSAATKRLC